MATPSPAVFLALVLLVGAGAGAAAQPRVPDCPATAPSIELSAESGARVPPVCISPKLPTTFWFDSELVPIPVEVQGRERFEDVSTGTRSFTVIPPADLRTGEHFKVVARFADDAAPASATLELVGHPSGAARRVEVFRHKRTVEEYQRELEEKDARLRQLEAELARVRAEGHGPSLSGLLAAGMMGWNETGVVARKHTRKHTPAPHDTLTVSRCVLYRSNTVRKDGSEPVVRVAGSVSLLNAGAPWTPVGAALVASDGRVKQLEVRAPEPIPADGQGVVYVETELTAQEARRTFTLKLWDDSGTRLVTLDDVTFP
jgi:uncharacterized protein (TIGR02268 family)